MEHDSGWESLDIQFVTAIAHIVVHEQLATIGRPATAILYKLVCANDTHNTIHCFGYPTLHKGIESEPSFIPTLVERLQSQDYILCMNSLLLLTAMLKYVTDEYRNDLTIALDQSNIKKNVIVSW